VKEPQPHCSYADDECADHSVQQGTTVHVLEISPLPKATHRADRKAVRAKGKAAVLTSSPYKHELMDKRRLEREKEAKAVARKARKLTGKTKSSTAKDVSATKTSKRKEMKKKKNESVEVACMGCGVKEHSVEDKTFPLMFSTPL
jgi:carbamoylphosphate synthase small subunit